MYRITIGERTFLHSALMANLMNLFQTRKKLLQHESITPIELGITFSQILQIQKINPYGTNLFFQRCLPGGLLVHHENITPIESGITLSQILQIQN